MSFLANTAIPRAIAGNEGTLQNIPSAEDLSEFNVVKYGRAIIATDKAKHKVVNPSRYVFLRRGVIGYCSKGSFSAKGAIENTLENQAANTRTFYISPQSTFERSGTSIVLNAGRTGATSLKWVDTTLSMRGQSLMRLTFSDEATAADWERSLSEMKAFMPLTRGCSTQYQSRDIDFPRRFNDLMWTIMLHSSNISLCDFYLNNLVDKITEDGGTVDHVGAHSCVKLFESVYRNLRKMLGGKLGCPNEEVLAYSLMRLCGPDPVERAFILLFAITSDAYQHVTTNEALWVSRCHDGAKAAARSKYAHPVKMIDILISSISQNPKLRKALLLLVGHPAASKTAVSGTVNWAKEVQWFMDLVSKRGDRLLILTPTDIDLYIRSPLWLLFRLLDDLLKVHQDSPEAQLIGSILSSVPEALILSKFEFEIKQGVIVSSQHLIDILFAMSAETRKDYLKQLCTRGLASNGLLEGLMCGGLRAEKTRELHECVVTLLFQSENVFDDIDAKSIGLLDEAPVIISGSLIALDAVDETKRKKIHSPNLEKDFCKFLLLLAMRFEYCDSRGITGVTTISKSLRHKVAGRKEAEKEMASLLKELDIIFCFQALYPSAVDAEESESMTPRKRKDVNLVRRIQETNRSHDDLRAIADNYDEDDDGNVSVAFRRTDSTVSVSSPKRGLVRQTSVADRTELSKDSLEHLILGLFSVSVWCNSPAFIDFCSRLPQRGKKIFSAFLAHDYPLRAKFIDIVRDRTQASAPVVALMRENILLNDVRHFKPEAMELLSLSSTTSNPRLFADLLGVTLKLRNYEGLKERVDALMKSLMVSSQSKLPILREIIVEVEKRSAEEMGNVSLEDLNSCINNGVTALALLSGAAQAVQHDQMFQMLCLYLKKEKPPAWTGLFKGAHTIAIFIKYMTREDFAKAYAMFNDLNEDSAELTGIIRTVRSIYAAPVVSPEEVKNIMENGTSREAVDGFLATIMEKSTSMDAEGKFIIKTSVDWMRFMYERINIPMAPRNSQLITMMTCVTWVRSIVSGSSASGSRALISQVGTGEGKSLIIAMSSIYLVKMLGMKVHVLENNSSLLEKDFAQFKTFYEQQGVSCCTRFSDPEADVTYCLRCDPEGKKDMEAFYRDNVYSGKEPFKKTVLIVDEVDELIVDGDPNVSYIKNVTGSGNQMKAAYDALRSGRSTKPSGVDDDVWDVASKAFRDSQSKVEGKDYVKSGSNVYLVWNGVIEKRLVNPWLNCLRYFAGSDSDVGVQSTFFVQSMPHMMSQYDCILGLSGSLGSASEREFLKQTYQAITMRTPSFLDTCKGVSKEPPVLIGNNVQVYASTAKQMDAVIDLAIEKFQFVPVLIVTKSTAEAELMHRTIVSRLGKSKYQSLLGGAPPDDIAQIFAKYTPGTVTEMNYPSIIEKATAQLDLGVKTRRITVTDPFGGRGHDFSLYDEDADTKGGMAVIATNIPPSERDWVQWKGRTARSDRKGQYAVILCKEDEPLKAFSASALEAMHRTDQFYDESLIRALLDVRDRETGAAIAEKGGEIMGGQRASELCDKFYLQYQREDDAPWYSGSHDKELSKFLKKGYSQFTKTVVDEFKSQVRLSYTSKYR